MHRWRARYTRARVAPAFWPARQHFDMQIRVLLFGVLKELVGRSTDILELPEGARVSDVFSHYVHRAPPIAALSSSLAFSVNQEYAGADQKLTSGDEVGLLPPVSGGTTADKSNAGEVRIIREPIATHVILSALKRPEDGAAIVFEGIVRNNTRGRRTLYLDYEAYESMALKQMEALSAQARERFAIRAVSIVHRLGRLEIGEASVLIVVASAHRGPAFEACHWIIDTLKKIVPIWKKEYFEDGAVWADGEPFPAEIRGHSGTIPANNASK